MSLSASGTERERVAVTGSMDSDEDNEMVKRFRESDIGEHGDKGPKSDGKQKTFTSYWYDMKTYKKLRRHSRRRRHFLDSAGSL